MKVVDMHCDTLYEMEKNHLSLSENNLNIDIKKMEEGDYLLQNFAIFTELKETAQSRLGDKFNLKEYLKIIMNIGPVTFDTLNERLDQWIANY